MTSEAVQQDPVDEFWQGIELCKTDWDIEYYLLYKMVHQFRETLDDDHVIAQAIDGKEPWVSIARQADENGFEKFAESLRFADRLFKNAKRI